MKVVLYTPVFWPSMGGVESISEALAEELIRADVELIVVTETPGAQGRDFPYEVIRRPNPMQRMRIAQWADIIHSNSASVAMWLYAELARKPFIWTHNGYQVACIDGLGWEQNALAPIDPKESFNHHLRLNGLKKAYISGAKLIFRRWLALKGVQLNVPATRWVSQRLKLPRSFQAYTPYPTNRFRKPSESIKPDHDFLFVGRLVSEKGVDVLIDAMSKLVRMDGHADDKLLIVGDGPMSEKLKDQVIVLDLQANVTFAGKLYGEALTDAMGRAQVAIVPSSWEEPMGGVTLELLATGRALIVSQRGGHSEVAGSAALSFPNFDSQSLAECMLQLSEDESLRKKLQVEAPGRVNIFSEEKLTARYIAVYRAVIAFWN